MAGRYRGKDGLEGIVAIPGQKPRAGGRRDASATCDDQHTAQVRGVKTRPEQHVKRRTDQPVELPCSPTCLMNSRCDSDRRERKPWMIGVPAA